MASSFSSLFSSAHPAMTNKLALVASACFQNDDAKGKLPLSSFLECVREVGECTPEELIQLETLFAAKRSGKIQIGNKMYKMIDGVIFGLSLKHRRSEICHVTSSNLDDIIPLYLQMDQVPGLLRDESSRAYKNLTQLRQQALELQRQLASETFDILSEDEMRYQKTRQENLTLDRTRRLARREQRQYFGPKPKIYPKKKKHLLARGFHSGSSVCVSRPLWTPLMGWGTEAV